MESFEHTYRHDNNGDEVDDEDNNSDYEIISMDGGDEELDSENIKSDSNNNNNNNNNNKNNNNNINYYCSNGNIEFLEKLIYSQFNDIQYPDVLESSGVIHEHVENIVKLFKSNPSNQKFTFKTYLYTTLITYIGCTSVICKNCNYYSDGSGTTVFHNNNNNNNRMSIDIQQTATTTTTLPPVITDVPLSTPKKATYNKSMLKSIKSDSRSTVTQQKIIKNNMSIENIVAPTESTLFNSNTAIQIYYKDSDDDDDDDDDDDENSSDGENDNNKDSGSGNQQQLLTILGNNNEITEEFDDRQKITKYIDENELGKEEFWNHLIKSTLLNQKDKRKFKSNLKFVEYGKQICKENNLNEKLFYTSFLHFKTQLLHRRIVRNITTYFNNTYSKSNSSTTTTTTTTTTVSPPPSTSTLPLQQEQQQQQQKKSLNWFDDVNVFIEFIKFKYNCNLKGSIVKERNIIKYVQYISKIKYK